MSDLIFQLTLGAGLNTQNKILEYLQISKSTWLRKVKSGRLSRCEFDALRHKNGYLLHDDFRDFRLVKNRIYSPENNFAHAGEIRNMPMIRDFLGMAWRDLGHLKAKIETLSAGYQADLFGEFEILQPKFDEYRPEKLFDLAN